MAIKISALTSLTTVADNDVIPILDFDTNITKKISRSDFLTSIPIPDSAVKIARNTNITASQTLTVLNADIAITGASISPTVPATGKDVEVCVSIPRITATGATNVLLKLWSGSVGGTLLQNYFIKMQDSGDNKYINFSFIHTPSAGAITYVASARTDTNNITLSMSATSPGQMWAKYI